jgi:hypothetical protein
MKNTLKKTSQALAFIGLLLSSIPLSKAQDFSSGDLTGWTSIGAVSVVASSYAPDILSGNAALLETGEGVVPIAQVFAFLEAEGVFVQDAPKQLPYFHEDYKGGHLSGMVGSALIADYSTALDFPVLTAWPLSNDIGENEERGGFTLAFRASDGRWIGGSVGLLHNNQSSKWEASGTPYAYQGTQAGGVIAGPDSNDEDRRVVYIVWELDPNAVDAGYGLLVEGPPEDGSAP